MDSNNNSSRRQQSTRDRCNICGYCSTRVPDSVQYRENPLRIAQRRRGLSMDPPVIRPESTRNSTSFIDMLRHTGRDLPIFHWLEIDETQRRTMVRNYILANIFTLPPSREPNENMSDSDSSDSTNDN